MLGSMVNSHATVTEKQWGAINKAYYSYIFGTVKCRFFILREFLGRCPKPHQGMSLEPYTTA